MGQHDPSGQIADGINARHRRAEVLIHRDESPVHIYTDSFPEQTVRHRDPSRSDQHILSGDLLSLAFFLKDTRDPVIVCRETLFHRRVQMSFDAPLLQDHFQVLRDLLVEVVQQFRQGFDDGDFRSQIGEYGGKFHADDAAANDHQTLRRVLQSKQAIAVQHMRQIHAGHRDPGRFRTGRQDHVFRAVHPGRISSSIAISTSFGRISPGIAISSSITIGFSRSVSASICGRDLHPVDTVFRGEQRSGPVDHGDAIGFQQLLDAADQLVDAFGLVIQDRLIIIGSLLCEQPELLPADRLAIKRRCMDHCFCRNAAPVQACSAHAAVLHHRHRQASLCSLYGRHISAGTRPDDDQIKLIIHMPTFSLSKNKGGLSKPADLRSTLYSNAYFSTG